MTKLNQNLMKKTLLFLLAAILMLSGCTKAGHANNLMYPDYDPAKAEPYAGVSATAEVLSPHRVMLTLKNAGETVLLDSTFALYDHKGKSVPCARLCEADGTLVGCYPKADTQICLSLGNQYGALKAGEYTLVKRVLLRRADGATEACGYISCPVKLPSVSQVPYEAEAMETEIIFGDGTPLCKVISATMTDVTPDSGQITWQNESEGALYLGSESVLYSLQGDEWLRVPFTTKPAHGLTLRIIEANESITEKLNWSTDYGSLQPGDYSLVRLVFENDTFENAQHLIVQFQIQ